MQTSFFYRPFVFIEKNENSEFWDFPGRRILSRTPGLCKNLKNDMP